ncbi:MAG: YicC family protein [Desulfovibrio sp.]|nr:YicC family protein [Desulfovibrio sp.]
MLRSMTGFGRCLMEAHDVTQQWEIKSVNGRYLDVKWRIPPFLHGLEPKLEKLIKTQAKRGRIEISLFLQFAKDAGPGVIFNFAQANAMLNALAELAESRGEEFTIDYSQLLGIQSLWKDVSEDLAENLQDELLEGLSLALDDWNEGRTQEGKALGEDLHSRILQMEEWTGLIAERAPLIKDERLEALRERLKQGLEQVGSELDEDRFLQEIVILTDRLDVTEELTRLHSHLEHLHEILNFGKEAGRKLDFTLQECFREINTCGNKISDANISRLVVDFKNELEKCREQVQNIE